MKTTRVTRVALVAMSLAVLLSACGEKQKVSNSANMDLSTYPIKTDAELSMWMELPTSTATSYSNFGDTEFAKEWMARTGVKINFIHPAAGQASEQFGLMVASNEMTDIVKWDWTTALGGPTVTVQDKVIIALDDYMQEYAPNLTKFLAEKPDVDKEIKNDQGQHYMFPFVRNDKKLLVSSGYIIRRDWLEKCGLSMPETVDELEVVLKAFKEKMGAKAPISIPKGYEDVLLRLFSAKNDFYIEDGKVKYGPIEPEYKEALVNLNRWFDEGLIDKNFISADQTYVTSNMVNGVSGLSYGSGGGQLGQWLESAAASGIELDLTGMRGMATEKGGLPRFNGANGGIGANGTTAITTACKYPELAVKVLDYGYSEEGALFFNFGTEGVSYNMVDGYPTYSDDIKKNPDGLTVMQAMGKHIMGHSNGPFIQDVRYVEQYYAKPQQQEALEAWSFGVEENMDKRLPILIYTQEEGSERASILTEIEKYRNEIVSSYITGALSMDSFDESVQRFKDLKIDRLVEITQAAYDRYVNR